MRKSELYSKTTDITKGQFMETFLELHQLSDYTDYLQLGQHDEVEYYQTRFTESLPSIQDQWPTLEDN